MTVEWATVQKPPPLAPDAVHIWFAQLALEAPEVFQSDLSPEEIARANRFLDTNARRAYICSHGLLRHLIAAYCRIHPGDVKFLTASGGKPALQGTNLRFSLSHSGDVALLAFALNTEIGVDIERVDSNAVDLATAELVFTPEELHSLREYEPCERAVAFFAGWTRKEAYGKCRGTGLNDLKHIQTGLSEQIASVDGITLRTFNCTEDHIGSLATRGEATSLAFLKWSRLQT
ncbi:MAG: 4'-phosphopantetheinyl transferase family protein [Acidobacteriaceae bacterium]